MKTFTYTITDKMGIHARPAGILVKEAKKYESEITISFGDKKADASKILAIMALGIKYGQEITVTVTGVDESKAVMEMESFFKANL